MELLKNSTKKKRKKKNQSSQEKKAEEAHSKTVLRRPRLEGDCAHIHTFSTLRSLDSCVSVTQGAITLLL